MKHILYIVVRAVPLHSIGQADFFFGNNYMDSASTPVYMFEIWILSHQQRKLHQILNNIAKHRRI